MNENSSANTHRRLILCVGLGIIAPWYGILLGSYLLVPTLKEAIRSHVVEALRGEFASNVQFQSFEVSLWPRVHITAHGVLIGNNATTPLMQASIAEAQSDLWPWHIRTLELSGLSLHIPAAPLSKGGPPLSSLTIAEIVSKHAQVEILPAGGQQAPIHFELTQFRATNFSSTRSANFSALVASAMPRAEIQTTGRFGPWNTSDPGATPLEGKYAAERCDFAFEPRPKSTFSSHGRFQGNLERIEIAGDASSPEFSLDSKAPPEPLQVTFQAAIDAWDGSASIEQIKGLTPTSSFVASGFVRNFQDERRRDIAVQISATPSRTQFSTPFTVLNATQR